MSIKTIFVQYIKINKNRMRHSLHIIHINLKTPGLFYIQTNITRFREINSVVHNLINMGFLRFSILFTYNSYFM